MSTETTEPVYTEEIEAAKDKLLSFMRDNSYATGHGDTFADLFREFEWQHRERINDLRETVAFYVRTVQNCAGYKPEGKSL